MIIHKSASDKMTEEFISLVQKDFEFPLIGRLEVIADVDHYKASEDESVWLQKKSDAPKMFEVYWDGEWIIDFAFETEISITLAIFWQGFLKAYSEGTISLNKGIATQKSDDINELIKQNQKRLDKQQLTLASPTEKLADEIIAGIESDQNDSPTAT